MTGRIRVTFSFISLLVSSLLTLMSCPRHLDRLPRRDLAQLAIAFLRFCADFFFKFFIRRFSASSSARLLVVMALVGSLGGVAVGELRTLACSSPFLEPGDESPQAVRHGFCGVVGVVGLALVCGEIFG